MQKLLTSEHVHKDVLMQDSIKTDPRGGGGVEKRTMLRIFHEMKSVYAQAVLPQSDDSSSRDEMVHRG
jgi:hypothetical protein